jgi:3-deoxy-D-manno-octulosonic-acid transferase
MGNLMFFLYRIFAVPLLKPAFFVGRFFNAKMKTGYEGRKNQFQFIEKELAANASGKHRIFFHASSVGESEQALPIIEKMKKANPDCYIIMSFFSPSGYKFLKNNPFVDLKIYLPLDTRSNARKLFSLLKPDLWCISKFDVWPNHLKVASKLKIPTVLTAATLSENSGRDKGLAGLLNKSFYNCFDHIFPISDEDAKRFLRIFPFPERMTMTGDTRFDQVYNKARKVENAGNVKIFKQPGSLVFMAGSIWPADEKHLLPAFINIMKKHTSLLAILVPHELHESHIADIENTLNRAGLESERYTDFEKNGGTEKRIAIINTVGMLARIYMQTNLAYVGGSFSSGVHNVMEPAVFGQPVIFGPVNANSFEAGELMKAGSAFAVENAAQIEEVLEKLVTDDLYRNEIGQKAKNLIYNNLGATERIYNHLKQNYGFIS